MMKIGYADPPYPGQAHLYKSHPDFGGEVDHEDLVSRLRSDFDGWVLHTSSTALSDVIRLAPDARVMAWVKPFAAFKRNVSPAYAWEPVLVKPCRKPVTSREMKDATGVTARDWISESITLKRGLTGAKPERVCWWLFMAVGARPGDHLADLYPGTGAVSRAWSSWCDVVAPVLAEADSEQSVGMATRKEGR